MKIGVLFSGRGTNLKSIIERSKQEGCRYEVVVSITDNLSAPGIQLATELGVNCVVVPNKNWEWHIYDILNKFNVELTVLAGFMRILPALFCMRWKNRCINIHPSLLPKYKGLHTHRRALEAGDVIHGCSIHFVTPELDDGPIVAQEQVLIQPGDTEQSLAARVLERENLLYPEVIQCIASRKITSFDNKVSFNGVKIESPLSLNDLL